MISKKVTYTIVAVILLIIIVTVITSLKTQTIPLTISTEENNIYLTVEIADSPEKRAKGLMFRETLDVNSGMLFTFDNSQRRAFWMKNTYIPLDIYFINEDKTILEIIHVDPCGQEECPQYLSKDTNVQYVLETNKGFAQEHEIFPGATITLN